MFFKIFILLFMFSMCYCDQIKYQTKQFAVPLDHFNFACNKTFQIKYLMNDSYWDKTSGPIFFYTGNEGAIEVFAENTGFMWDIAEEFNALLLFAEHRYYGTSLPFGKASNKSENLGYLSSSQALADFADLLSYFQTNQNPGKYPVIAFGGSYGGMLAAWFRMKYPHLVAGAIAASAPIHQFTDMIPCDAFARITTSSYENINRNCSQNIRDSWALIRNFTKNDDGRKFIDKEWKLCSPLSNTTKSDSIVSFLTDIYTNMAMVNYPYESNFLVPLPANPVRAACAYLKTPLKDKDLIKGIGQVLEMYSNFKKTKKCLDLNENTEGNLDAENWNYQVCTEMLMPFCSTGVSDMFEAVKWDFNAQAAECKRTYNVTPQPYFAQSLYGGNNIRAASNIVFSNGLLDPWASGGILSDINDSVKAVILIEGAHHLDLRGANKNDPYSVKQARELHKRNIKAWIRNYWTASGNSVH